MIRWSVVERASLIREGAWPAWPGLAVWAHKPVLEQDPELPTLPTRRAQQGPHRRSCSIYGSSKRPRPTTSQRKALTGGVSLAQTLPWFDFASPRRPHRTMPSPIHPNQGPQNSLVPPSTIRQSSPSLPRNTDEPRCSGLSSASPRRVWEEPLSILIGSFLVTAWQSFPVHLSSLAAAPQTDQVTPQPASSCSSCSSCCS